VGAEQTKMSLFTDGPFITQADLIRVDSEIPIIVGAQAIDLDECIAQASQEVGHWLIARMQRWAGRATDAVMSWHISATGAGRTESENRARLSLSQVVVTDPELPGFKNSLGILCLYETLYQFYRNASRAADIDRYEEKRDAFLDEIQKKYKPRMIAEGVAVVGIPMPAPAARWQTGTGKFEVADVSGVSGGSVDTDQDIDIALTYIDPTKSNAESGPSARVPYTIVADEKAVVSAARLRPPTGQTRAGQLPRVLVAEHNATHWNVYAGERDGVLYLQNESPIAIGTTSFTFPAALATTTEIGLGQYADQFLSMPTLMGRG
jgi:hypothetical protein